MAQKILLKIKSLGKAFTIGVFLIMVSNRSKIATPQIKECHKFKKNSGVIVKIVALIAAENIKSKWRNLVGYDEALWIQFSKLVGFQQVLLRPIFLLCPNFSLVGQIKFQLSVS